MTAPVALLAVLGERLDCHVTVVALMGSFGTDFPDQFEVLLVLPLEVNEFVGGV